MRSRSGFAFLCVLAVACSDAGDPAALPADGGALPAVDTGPVLVDSGQGLRPDAAWTPDVGAPTDSGVEADASFPPDAGRASDAAVFADSGAPQTDAGMEISPIEIEILSPQASANLPEGRVTLTASVSGFELSDLSDLTVLWSSDIDGALGSGPVEADGQSVLEIASLSGGVHQLSATVTLRSQAVVSETIEVTVCGWRPVESFSAPLDPSIWKVYGDAFQDPGGWLELTDAIQDRKGAIFNIDRSLQPGDLEMRFRISTGSCAPPGQTCPESTGADGFSMSIFAVGSVTELDTLVAEAQSGGGLGYGVGGPYGTFAGSAFHIEFDTWQNVLNPVELHTDPTDQDHIAVTLDGNPGHHVLWREIADLEDNLWHEVELAIRGSKVRVAFDGQTLIDETVDGLRFDGGFVGFTGTTGFFTNYHRFDDLQIRQACP